MAICKTLEMKDILSLKKIFVHAFAFMLILDILLCMQIDSIDFIMRPISLQECIMKGH